MQYDRRRAREQAIKDFLDSTDTPQTPDPLRDERAIKNCLTAREVSSVTTVKNRRVRNKLVRVPQRVHTANWFTLQASSS